MSQNIHELVDRFWTPYQPDENELTAAELSQISEDAPKLLDLNPPSVCLEWWASLTEEVRKKWLANPKTPTMYGAWRMRVMRQKAVNFARANVGLSGFTPSSATEVLALRYINGEIDIAAFVEVLKDEV